MLTKLDSNGIIYNEEKVTASIQSFWSTSSIITREVEEIKHLRGITGSGGDDPLPKISKLIQTRLEDYQVFCQSPTEKFIEIHDRLHNLLINSELPSTELEKIDFIFDEIIRHLIIQLKKVSFLQSVSRSKSSTQQEMIDRRSGIVVGATLALNILISILEGDR